MGRLPTTIRTYQSIVGEELAIYLTYLLALKFWMFGISEFIYHWFITFWCYHQSKTAASAAALVD